MNRFVESIRESIRLIKVFPVDRYVKDDLGVLSMADIRPVLNKLFDRLEVTNEVADELDDVLAERLANVLRKIQKDFLALVNVPPDRFASERANWLNEIRKLIGEFNALWPSISAERTERLEIPQVDFEEFLRRTREETSGPSPNTAPLLAKLSELEKTIKSVQSKQAANRTANNFRHYFEKQASSHSQKMLRIPDGDRGRRWIYGGAQLWLCYSIGAVAILCVVLGCWTSEVSLTKQITVAADAIKGVPRTTYYEFDPGGIPSVVGHILLLSVLLFVVRFCFRQYSIHQHLYTVNAHKSNLAGTFYEILASSVGEDAGSRAIVTQETIRTLASFEGSGYVDSSNPDMHSPIEIIAKGFVDTAKSQTNKG